MSSPPTKSIQITVNGKSQTIPHGSSVLDLVHRLALSDQPVAVERNHAVIPRAQHATATLCSGDRLEIVTFVGGG